MLGYQIEIKRDIAIIKVVNGDVATAEIPGLMPLDPPDTDGLPVIIKGDGLNPLLAAVIASALDADTPWVAVWDARAKCGVVIRVCAIGTAKLGKLVC